MQSRRISEAAAEIRRTAGRMMCLTLQWKVDEKNRSCFRARAGRCRCWMLQQSACGGAACQVKDVPGIPAAVQRSVRELLRAVRRLGLNLPRKPAGEHAAAEPAHSASQPAEAGREQRTHSRTG